MNNEAKNSVLRVRELTWLAALMALQIILSKLTLGNNFLRIGFGFIATALIGYYFGPIKSAIAGVLTDIIANTIFPDPAGFFWGFTLSAAVSGFIYGLILYHKKINLWRVLLVVISIVVIINMLLTTLWVSMMGSTPFMSMFLLRLPKELITIPIQTLILWFVLTWVDRSRFRRID